MNSSSSHQRIPFYDTARGIGIILVVIGHTIPFDSYASAFVYSFHMPLFFFITGSVMGDKRYDSWKKILLSEHKLISSYLFYSAVYVVFDFAVRFAALQQIGKRDLFWDAYRTLTGYGINVLWFLFSLAVAKIITRLCVTTLKKRGRILALSLMMFVGGAYTGNLLRTNVQPQGWENLWYIPCAAILCTMTMAAVTLLAHAMRDFTYHIITQWKWLCAAGLLINIVLCNAFGKIDYHSLGFGIPLLTMVLAASGVIGALGVSEMISGSKQLFKIFSWFSKNSMFIMVTHEYLRIKEYLIAPVLSPFHLNAPIFLVLVLTLLLVIEIPLCIYIQPFANKCVSTIDARLQIIKA